MAHASSMEKAKLQMKKIRKQRTKRKIAINKEKEKLGEDEWLKKQKEKGIRSLKSIISIALWDIKHNQFPMTKKKYIVEKMKSRVIEIDSELENNLNNLYLENEKKEIEAILNDFRG